MRLSEAIATRRVLLKPMAGFLRAPGNRGCALGMAALANGLELVASGDRNYQENYDRIHKNWPWLMVQTEMAICPCNCNCGQAFVRFSSAITHVFDTHVIHEKDWTLDQLIDWVRSVEPAEPAEVPAAEPVVINQAVAEAVAEAVQP